MTFFTNEQLFLHFQNRQNCHFDTFKVLCKNFEVVGFGDIDEAKERKAELEFEAE
jgi:hypothetical protein